MPVMKNGTFRLYEDIRNFIDFRRSLANAILRLAKSRGIHNQAVDNAEADIVRMNEMEAEYFNETA